MKAPPPYNPTRIMLTFHERTIINRVKSTTSGAKLWENLIKQVRYEKAGGKPRTQRSRGKLLEKTVEFRVVVPPRFNKESNFRDYHVHQYLSEL